MSPTVGEARFMEAMPHFLKEIATELRLIRKELEELNKNLKDKTDKNLQG